MELTKSRLARRHRVLLWDANINVDRRLPVVNVIALPEELSRMITEPVRISMNVSNGDIVINFVQTRTDLMSANVQRVTR